MQTAMKTFLHNPFMLLFVIAWLLVIWRVLQSVLAPTKTVHAQIVNKQMQERFSKYSGNGKGYSYSVTFLADGERLIFNVSEFSYHSYRLKETGMLTYKGKKLIKFQ